MTNLWGRVGQQQGLDEHNRACMQRIKAALCGSHPQQRRLQRSFVCSPLHKRLHADLPCRQLLLQPLSLLCRLLRRVLQPASTAG